ncbi:MAG: FAD-dependent monooxygenase, partial [Armatimonadetes bacterium]|nr:FAD-dependent monooxygenase [Anaerolineae bacterium]
MNTHSVDYDVIIVGGRPAGSTLAARLGQYGLRVLLLERGTFPSLPAV